MTQTQRLIHLRPLSNDHQVWEQIANGELLRIAPWVATPRDYFEQLPTYERQRLKVIAAGKSVHKAIMIGKSAARLWGIWVLRLSAKRLKWLGSPNRCQSRRRFQPITITARRTCQTTWSPSSSAPVVQLWHERASTSQGTIPSKRDSLPWIRRSRRNSPRRRSCAAR